MGSESLPAGTVTFLFTDIEGSTRLLQRLGKEYAAVLADQRQIIRAAFPGSVAARSILRETRSLLSSLAPLMQFEQLLMPSDN